MPHFVLDCSNAVIESESPQSIMQLVYTTAESTGLFEPNDIKVRIHPFQCYTIANAKNDFIHVFAYILQGRTDAQKEDLSHRIVSALKEMFPEVPVISVNVSDFEKPGYCNKTMV